MHKRRRLVSVAIILLGIVTAFVINTPPSAPTTNADTNKSTGDVLALQELGKLPIKGRAPKTDYSREQFGDGWQTKQGCDTRNIILNRDMTDVVVDESCNVTKGILQDPYTGKTINFTRGSLTSGEVQIDHVVALSDAWQTGAQLLAKDVRIELANDPLELLAVDGPANQQKSDGDVATWLPSNKPFRCQYVARQIAVKIKYKLWLAQAEHDVMNTILSSCSNQGLPSQ